MGEGGVFFLSFSFNWKKTLFGKIGGLEKDS